MSPFPLCAGAAVRRCAGLGTSLAVLVATVLAGASAQEPKDVPSARDELLRRSSFVFAGTVREVRASTVKLVPAGDNTAVVRVDRIVKGADTVGEFTGEDVTVVLQEPRSVGPGGRFTFFTNPKVSSRTLAVDEVGHLPVASGREAADLKERSAEVDRQAEAKKLEGHLAQADMIVVGRVIATKPVAPEEGSPVPSEHDPEWWEATIRVQGVEKGEAPATGVQTIYYPHSRDIRWFAVPKLDQVQDGIFLLHSRLQPQAEAKDEAHEQVGVDIKGLKILHPEDVQPVARREQIRAMLRR